MTAKAALLEWLASAPPSVRVEFCEEVQLLAPRCDPEAGVLKSGMWAASVRLTDGSDTAAVGRGCGCHKADAHAAAAADLMAQPAFHALSRKTGANQLQPFVTSSKAGSSSGKGRSRRKPVVYGVSAAAVAKAAAAAAKAAAAAAAVSAQRCAETNVDAGSDYVGRLQQVMQAAGLAAPTYQCERVMPPAGSDNTAMFAATVRVTLPGPASIIDSSTSHALMVSGLPQRTKQLAEQAAAAVMVSSPALQQQLTTMRPVGRKQKLKQPQAAYRSVPLPAAGPSSNSRSSQPPSVAGPPQAVQQLLAAAAAVVPSQQEPATMPPEAGSTQLQLMAGAEHQEVSVSLLAAGPTSSGSQPLAPSKPPQAVQQAAALVPSPALQQGPATVPPEPGSKLKQLQPPARAERQEVSMLLPAAVPSSSSSSSQPPSVAGPPQAVLKAAAAVVVQRLSAVQPAPATLPPEPGSKQPVSGAAAERQEVSASVLLPAAGHSCSSNSQPPSVAGPPQAVQQLLAAAAAVVPSPALQQEPATMPPEAGSTQLQLMAGAEHQEVSVSLLAAGPTSSGSQPLAPSKPPQAVQQAAALVPSPALQQGPATVPPEPGSKLKQLQPPARAERQEVSMLLPAAVPSSSSSSSQPPSVAGPPQAVLKAAAAVVVQRLSAVQPAPATLPPEPGSKQPVSGAAAERQEVSASVLLPAAGHSCSSNSQPPSVAGPPQAVQQLLAAAAAVVPSPALQQEPATMPPEAGSTQLQLMAGAEHQEVSVSLLAAGPTSSGSQPLAPSEPPQAVQQAAALVPSPALQQAPATMPPEGGSKQPVSGAAAECQQVSASVLLPAAGPSSSSSSQPPSVTGPPQAVLKAAAAAAAAVVPSPALQQEPATMPPQGSSNASTVSSQPQQVRAKTAVQQLSELLTQTAWIGEDSRPQLVQKGVYEARVVVNGHLLGIGWGTQGTRAVETAAQHALSCMATDDQGGSSSSASLSSSGRDPDAAAARMQAAALEAFNQLTEQAVAACALSGAGAHTTTVAAFLVTTSVEGSSSGSAAPRVVALGTGTAVLSQRVLQQQPAAECGQRVLDSHAEVVARRGLLRWLHEQARLALASQQPGAAAAGDSVLEVVQVPAAAGSSSGSSSSGGGIKLRLRAGVQLHLYISQPPCGDATVRPRVSRQPATGAASTAAAAAPAVPHAFAKPVRRLPVAPKPRFGVDAQPGEPGMHLCLPEAAALSTHWPHACPLLNAAHVPASCGLLHTCTCWGDATTAVVRPGAKLKPAGAAAKARPAGTTKLNPAAAPFSPAGAAAKPMPTAGAAAQLMPAAAVFSPAVTAHAAAAPGGGGSSRLAIWLAGPAAAAQTAAAPSAAPGGSSRLAGWLAGPAAAAQTAAAPSAAPGGSSRLAGWLAGPAGQAPASAARQGVAAAAAASDAHQPQVPACRQVPTLPAPVSCSDKLAAWNALGVQGALLGALLLQPLYITTLVISGPPAAFCEGAVCRAVCCRLAPDTGPCTEEWVPAGAGCSLKAAAPRMTAAVARGLKLAAPFCVNHPRILYASEPEAAAGQPGSALAPPTASSHAQPLSAARAGLNWNAGEPGELEVCDAAAGTVLRVLPVRLPVSSGGSDGSSSSSSSSGRRFSRLSKAGLFASFQRLQRQATAAALIAEAPSGPAALSRVLLLLQEQQQQSYRDAKRQANPDYFAAKAALHAHFERLTGQVWPRHSDALPALEAFSQ